MDEKKFDDIRSYRDNEFDKIKERLLNMPMLEDLVQNVFPDWSFNDFSKIIQNCSSIAEFQEKISYPVVVKLIDSTCSNFTFTGIDNLNSDSAYLFLTNHRDIVFDQLLFGRALYENNINTAEVAIGDNLITEEWIKELMRINKSFIVKRNLPARELVLESRKLSEYIFYNLTVRKHSVWIAQREGRAKDNNDRTQQGLLNMLGLTVDKNLPEHFMNLNIVPVSMSYEYDPCDIDKVKAIYAERTYGKYVKKPGEDIETMKKGLLGYKGHVHIHFSKPLNKLIHDIPPETHKNQFYNILRNIIDRKIIEGYQLWKSNYIAYDIYLDSEKYKSHYSTADKKKFIKDIEDKIDQLEGDKDALKSIFLEISARPLINLNEVKSNATEYQKSEIMR